MTEADALRVQLGRRVRELSKLLRLEGDELHEAAMRDPAINMLSKAIAWAEISEDLPDCP